VRPQCSLTSGGDAGRCAFDGIAIRSDFCRNATVMTMHEALVFLDWLHGEIKLQGKFSEKGSWPTRELIAVNLRANKECYPRDRRVDDSFYRQMSIARKRRWAVQGPCSRSCHANHLWLTTAGLAVLEMMNREGCCPECGNVRHQASGLRFKEEKEAA
jgi:hypothetical protein